jgi:hypothetical protein
MEETAKSVVPAATAPVSGVADAKTQLNLHTVEEASSHAHGEEHEPHMPAPSLSPIILGAGMTLAAFGLVLGPVVLILGAIGILVGLGTWLYDEIVNASAATSDHE